jgi:hypothetical protein
MFAVNERMNKTGQSWEEFAVANPDLLDWRNSILRRYYTEETLASQKARRMFVLPDRSLAG